MPSFNINQLFARKKSCTEPVYKIPSNTREWLGIDTVQKNGIFKIEPMKGVAMYDRCYIFEDVNYINKDIQRMARAGESGIPVSNQMIEKDTDDWKNQIVPAFIDATDDYMKINDRYACVLFAHDYDQSLNEEKVLHALTDVTFPVYITLDMEPIRKRLLKDRLLAAHTNNEKNMSSERESLNNKGQYTADNSYTLKKKKEELENLMDQVDGNDEEALYLGLLVMVSADSPEVLEQRADTLMQIATSNGYTLDPYYHRQIRAFNTVLPIGGRQVNQMRPIITSSAVAFQPFYAKDMQSGKYIYGLNKTKETAFHLIIYPQMMCIFAICLIHLPARRYIHQI